MSRITRRRRVRCKLPCEIVQSRRRHARGRIVTLSEGGLAVVTTLHFDQGDPIRIVINPDGRKPIKVSAIVWNERTPAASDRSSSLRRLGCVISEPPASFMALLDQLAPASEPPRLERVPLAPPKPRDLEAESCEADLPRPRELEPPPKPEPEESLPYFRVRMKQIGGPRTRILTVRARSASHAETLATDELAKVCKDADGWGVLHIAKLASSGH